VPKRPSPALVLSVLALFVALGGTGLAATLGHSAAHTAKSTQPLTVRRVKRLIAAYLKAHPARRGAIGPRGPAGIPGGTGPQGPGATQIQVTQGTNTGTPVATAGPWTIRMACFPGGTASVNITGPGSYYDTTALATLTPASPATVHVDNALLGAGGLTRNTLTAGQQISEDVQLISGTTMYELHLQLSSLNIDPTTPSCTMVGSILPVT
jgi:hypothetical protein